MEVLGRVLILRLVAAPDVPTAHAQPQMHPGVADLQAILTAIRAGRYVVYLIEMGTGLYHYPSLYGGLVGRLLSESL
jgi:hypothetical protein